MNFKTTLVIVGLCAAMSTTTTQAIEPENAQAQASRSTIQDTAREDIAQHSPYKLSDEQMDQMTAGQVEQQPQRLPGQPPVLFFFNPHEEVISAAIGWTLELYLL
jgi:hypothetical protein